MLVGLRGLAQAVGEVEQSAILLVPSGGNGPVEHLRRLLDKGLVPGALGVLQQEPDALDVVSGVDGAALGVVQPGSPVHVHVFQGALQLRLYVVLENVVYALLGPLFVEGLPLRVRPQQHAGDVQDNHGGAEGPARPGLRDGLGAHAHGVRHALAQVPVQVIALPGPFQPGLVPRYAVVLGVGDGAEGLGKVVAPLAEGLALCGDGKIHPVAALVVEAVLLHKVQAAFRRVQPLLLHTVVMAQESENPAAAALHPHAFVGGVDTALPVQAGVHSTMLLVHSMLQPEVGGAFQLGPDPGPGFLQFLPIHHIPLF